MPVTVSYSTERIIVNTQEVFAQGGAVHIWATGVSKELEKVTGDLMPPNRTEARWGTWATGRLRASLYREVFALPPAHEVQFEVGVRAPYAKYVHDGTGHGGQRFIYTHQGWANKNLVDSWVRQGFFEGSDADQGMWMPVTRVPGLTRYFLRVRGQKANPFLDDAYRVVRYRHPGLPRR